MIDKRRILTNVFAVDQTHYIRILFIRLLIILLLFSICRFLFYLFNISSFSESDAADIASAFLYGIRFDISAIVYFNLLFISLHLIPNPYREKTFYRFFMKLTFFVFNAFAYLLNIIDFEYFKFTKKRTTFDVFGMKSDFLPLLPEYLKDYWYLVIILTALICLAWFLYRKTEWRAPSSKINYFVQSIYLIISISIFLVAARGGFQLKPLRIMDAALYASPKTIPLVLNTPFTMLQTYGRKQLVEINYMSIGEEKKLFPIQHRLQSHTPMRRKNVVIIIVESLSREFMAKYGASKSYTPFLDSLSSKALVCKNSFSNGTRSMEAIPAVLASIPHLVQDSYIYSAYQGNRINSIGSILVKEGYRTAFFHGGTNGTMGFDSFIKMAGFQKYYGRDEYNNDKDFDGLWGIYDEEFLHFTALKLDETPPPFCAAVFTLSSHHPISVPPKHAGRFEGGTLGIHKGIKYVDYALSRFFDVASKMKWYNNTIFVITGDHIPDESEDPFYRNYIGMFAVPIIFFLPDTSVQGTRNITTQHVDIMPSILDYLDYNGEFISFGRSIFDSTYTGYSYNYINDTYEIVDDKYALHFNGDKSIGLFNYTEDNLLSKNYIGMIPDIQLKLESHLKAIIQSYRHAMIADELTIGDENKIRK